MKLLIELVPSTSHFKNLRSELKASEWDKLRKDSYKNANYVCEICGGKGHKHPVECHEIWDYEFLTGTQKLTGLIALCPKCHEVKHIGLAEIRGRLAAAKKHLSKVNNWSVKQTEEHVLEAFNDWVNKSKLQWKLDISWANEKLNLDI